ncbi:hypothetical protein AB6E53_02490 [Vibrio breoganii]|uniref:Uncharacterized protein n=1 Tax=Vibrio breoganii TaxID=553239 RepID=A0AAP8SWT1_9VIBR|nr:hypothetical protein [Vibrio breoganii]PMP10255.1 hypothetical protein BCS93_11305 [Vibrio breoganii]
MKNSEFVTVIGKPISTELRNFVRVLYNNRREGITKAQIIAELGCSEERLRTMTINLQRSHKVIIEFTQVKGRSGHLYMIKGLEPEDPLRTWEVQLLNRVFC